MRLESLEIPIRFDENGFDVSLSSIKSKLTKLGGEAAALGAIGGVGAAYISFLSSTIQPAADAETANSRLAAALAASGRNAETSAPQLGIVATHLAGMSTFSDEDILNAFQVMTTFSTVPTSAFEAVGKMAMDMAAFGEGGGSVAGNVEAIGRVLETGIIPRTWAFTDAQKEQFKALHESGDNAGALAFLLDTLNAKYGGQAAAELSTYNGQVKDLKDKWGEFKESIGSGIIPALTSLLGFVNKNFEGITNFATGLYAIINPAWGVAKAIDAIRTALAGIDWSSLPSWLYTPPGEGSGIVTPKGDALQKALEALGNLTGSSGGDTTQTAAQKPFDYHLLAQILAAEVAKVAQ